jgi:DNA-binding MarR family transcriptional regulator
MQSRQDPALAVFDTVFELTVKLGQLMTDGLAERGLTASQAEVLFRLHGEGPLMQRELSEALRCTPRHVTGLVDQLEGAGLAERGPHPADRRATLVTLTAKGRKLADRIMGERGSAAQALLGDLPAGDLTTTAAVLRTFVDRLDEGEVGGPRAG